MPSIFGRTCMLCLESSVKLPYPKKGKNKKLSSPFYKYQHIFFMVHAVNAVVLMELLRQPSTTFAYTHGSATYYLGVTKLQELSVFFPGNISQRNKRHVVPIMHTLYCPDRGENEGRHKRGNSNTNMVKSLKNMWQKHRR